MYTTSINESLSLLAQWNLHALVLHGTQVLRHTNRGPSIVHGYPEREGIYKVYWDVGWKHDWKVVHLGLTQRQQMKQNKKRINYSRERCHTHMHIQGGWTPQCASGAPEIEIMCKMGQHCHLDIFLKIRQEPLYEITFNTNCKRLNKIACLLH